VKSLAAEYCRGDYWPGPGTYAYLVDAGNQRTILLPELLLE
jgi:hypothetical protein